jgi:hypothetical protein
MPDVLDERKAAGRAALSHAVLRKLRRCAGKKGRRRLQGQEKGLELAAIHV